jgi:Zn-finger in ubiquitin-hydrolases and other protein
MAACAHVDSITEARASGPGCEECLATGGHWVHLRMCQSCGHVGCCDVSPGRHSTAHFRSTSHSLIRAR